MRASGSSSNLSGASAAGQPTAQQQQLAMQQLAMQQQLLMQQQAAAQAGARAPSSAGGMQLPPTAPGATIPAPPGATLPAYTVFGMDATTKQLKPFQLPPDFVAAKKEFVTTHIGNPAMHPYICQEYIRWVGERQTAQAAGAAKRPKLEPGATGGAAASVPLLQHQVALQAMGGARPPLYPAGMMAQQLTAQAQAAQAQARLQAQLNLANQKFAPIVRPATEEEKQFAPKQRLQALVRQVGLGMSIASAKATDDAQDAMQAVAEDFVSGAVSFAVSMARRRKAEEVEPDDLRVYLERTWNLQVPGFSGGDIKPYQRQPATKEHQQRMAAVRRAMAAAAAAGGGPQAGGGGGAAGGAQQGAAGAGTSTTAAGGGGGGAAAGKGGGAAAEVKVEDAAGGAAAAAQPAAAQQQAAGEGGGDDMPDAANGTA